MDIWEPADQQIEVQPINFEVDILLRLNFSLLACFHDSTTIWIESSKGSGCQNWFPSWKGRIFSRTERRLRPSYKLYRSILKTMS